jgi:hypothetical protein
MEDKPCNERISIQKKGLPIKNMQNESQYELKQSIFDPSKSSPPNVFMEKLRVRMSIYESFSKNFPILTNE